MNCINSCFDTRPFWSTSIRRNNCCVSFSPCARARLPAAKAGVDDAPATSDIVIKVIFAILDMILSSAAAIHQDRRDVIKRTGSFKVSLSNGA
jgi:hypothetical protein